MGRGIRTGHQARAGRQPHRGTSCPRRRHCRANRTALGTGPGSLPRGLPGLDPPRTNQARVHRRTGNRRRTCPHPYLGAVHRRAARARPKKHALADDRRSPGLDRRHPGRRAASGRADLYRPGAGRHLNTLKTENFEERNNERSRSCR